MTDARTAWIRVRERKRTAISWLVAFGLYLLAFAVAAIIASFGVMELEDYSGPVVVRLGSPDGIDVPRQVERTPAAAVPAQATPPAPTPENPEQTPVAALPTPVAAKPAPATTPAAAPSNKTPAKTPAATAPATPTPAATPPAPAPIVIKGSESGNSYDMTIDGGTGRAGRSLYVPIMLFMPLPFDVPASMYDAIPDLGGLPGTAEQRRQVFRGSYDKHKDGHWQLKKLQQPKYDLRPELWTMLEDAGYDLKNAEYKSGKSLNRVEILFKVSAAGDRGVPVLEDVLIERSSNYSDIDDAVLYGFRKAEFSNSGTSSIKGRFTYRF